MYMLLGLSDKSLFNFHESVYNLGCQVHLLRSNHLKGEINSYLVRNNVFVNTVPCNSTIICFAKLNTIMRIIIYSYVTGYIFQSNGTKQTTYKHINQKYISSVNHF